MSRETKNLPTRENGLHETKILKLIHNFLKKEKQLYYKIQNHGGKSGMVTLCYFFVGVGVCKLKLFKEIIP